MITFPLIRSKRTNEQVMSDVFKILLLYHLPLWVKDPVEILRFLLLVSAGTLIDVIFSLIHYKKVWCCVSGAITAAIINLLTTGAPLWGQLLGVVIGLVVGKHLWGGTGKNILNPAMVGLFWVMLLFPVEFPFFRATLLLLPALLLGFLFLKIRPFAGAGFIVGMLAAMIVFRGFSPHDVITYGVLFWSCLIMTDPVTVTGHKTVGAICGLLAGFAVYLFRLTPTIIPLCILMVNLVSSVAEEITGRKPLPFQTNFRIPKAVTGKAYHNKLIDLSGQEKKDDAEEDFSSLSGEEIFNRIQKNEVFGMGGAAFPTHRKLTSLLNSGEQAKHLIINGVECDPGLIHDVWLLRNCTKEIQKGIDILKQWIGFDSVSLAVKSQEELDYAKTVRQVTVPDSYPIGYERLLIKRVLGREITNQQLPAEAGILVLNVQTVYSIWQAVSLNQKIDSRFLTVADLKQRSAQVVRVKLGSSLKSVLEAVYPGEVNIFTGGGIMQAYLAEDASVVEKGTNLIATGNYPHYKESPQCSHCESCRRHCPAGLKVDRIAELVDSGKAKNTQKYHVSNCIGCGSCSYSCPGGRNLAARVKLAKDTVK